MPRRAAMVEPDSLLADALSASVGAAIVLDAELRIALVSTDAEALLNTQVPIGASAPKFLCGDASKRPVAEALAAGHGVEAIIPSPVKGSVDRLLKVRSIPLKRGEERTGWLLLLDEAGSQTVEPVLFHGMWTQTPRMKEVFRILERVAPEDATVLVRGETGTGKELVARALHALSKRADGPFRAINCAALPSNLLESELFGHARGAFTGAVRDTPGHIVLAHRGTLFLDEVAELPLELQAKLLRVLETRSVIPVGAREPVDVDVRIVSATHRSLRSDVENGRFRADLMYRLRVIPIFLPALRERPDDIGLLCDKLIEKMNASSRRTVERLSPSALAVLERYDWPGNIRELSNALVYAYAIGDGPILQPNDLPSEILRPSFEGTAEAPSAESDRAPLEPEASRLLEVLDRAGGSRAKAAQILGMSRVTLWRKLRAFGLEGRTTA